MQLGWSLLYMDSLSEFVELIELLQVENISEI